VNSSRKLIPKFHSQALLTWVEYFSDKLVRGSIETNFRINSISQFYINCIGERVWKNTYRSRQTPAPGHSGASTDIHRLGPQNILAKTVFRMGDPEFDKVNPWRSKYMRGILQMTRISCTGCCITKAPVP